MFQSFSAFFSNIFLSLHLGGRKESAYIIGKSIYKNKGMKGFYKGWSSTILRDVPFSCIYWFSYERLKIFYKEFFNNDQSDNNYFYFLSSSFCENILSNSGLTGNSLEENINNNNNNINNNPITFVIITIMIIINIIIVITIINIFFKRVSCQSRIR